MKFSKFLLENAILKSIVDIISDFDEDELAEFGELLDDEYFDGEYDFEMFSIEEITAAINKIDADEYATVKSILDEINDDSEELEEAISLKVRQARARNMKKIHKRLMVAKNKHDNRASSNDEIMTKARIAAHNLLRAKFSGGKDKEELSRSDKERIEARIAKMSRAINVIARKQFTKIKQADKARKKLLKQNKLENKEVKNGII